MQVAAINKIMSNAKKMKRVKIDPKSLMQIVFGVTFGITIFLIVWTVVDGSNATKNLDLAHESEQAVILSYSCASSSDGWKNSALTWEFFLLYALPSSHSKHARRSSSLARVPFSPCWSTVIFLCSPSGHRILPRLYDKQ